MRDEFLIFIRNRWEIARKATNHVTNVECGSGGICRGFAT